MEQTTQDITGIVFDIKKYAIHDGPGIRTTVFIKGCPLRCRWCHNPESWSDRPELMFSNVRCIQCGDCVRSCPQQAIHVKNGHCPETDASLCTVCGRCVDVCPTQTRKIAGFTVSVDQVMHQVLKDSVFYDESGGGVTFSGGEPLTQPVFLKAALTRLRQVGLHTAVDTCLFAPQSVLEEIISETDLFLCDLKHLDAQKHRDWTGCDNSQILANFRYLAAAGAEIIVRIPVVPGFNDTAEEIKNIAAFIKSLKTVRQVNLLPYNSGGVSKGWRLLQSKEILQCQLSQAGKMEELETIVESFGFQMKEG